MGSENEDAWVPRSRVGAVVVALLNGDEEAAERAAEQPPDQRESPVLSAAIRLAVRSLFDEDTPPGEIAEFVATMAQDVELDPAVAEALIRAQLGESESEGDGDGDGAGGQGLLDAFPEQEVTDTTWSMLGYLCERQLGREDSLELVAQAEEAVL